MKARTGLVGEELLGRRVDSILSSRIEREGSVREVYAEVRSCGNVLLIERSSPTDKGTTLAQRDENGIQPHVIRRRVVADKR